MRYFKLIIISIFVLAISFAFTKSNNSSYKQDDGMSIEEYTRKTENKEKIVLVYFSADWCKPCVKMKSIVEQLEKEEKDKMEVLNIDVDNNPRIALHFEINTLPLFYIYKDGKKKWENNTFMNKAD